MTYISFYFISFCRVAFASFSISFASFACSFASCKHASPDSLLLLGAFFPSHWKYQREQKRHCTINDFKHIPWVRWIFVVGNIHSIFGSSMSIQMFVIRLKLTTVFRLRSYIYIEPVRRSNRTKTIVYSCSLFLLCSFVSIVYFVDLSLMFEQKRSCIEQRIDHFPSSLQASAQHLLFSLPLSLFVSIKFSLFSWKMQWIKNGLIKWI